MAEVALAHDGIDRLSPAGVHGVSLMDVVLSWYMGDCFYPVEVNAAVVDHLVGEVGAVDVVAEEEGFLEEDTGAAEGVEETGACHACATITRKRLHAGLNKGLCRLIKLGFQMFTRNSSLARSNFLGRWGEVDHYLGEFWGEHADECIALWAFLVTASEGGDVLSTDAFGDDDFAGFAAYDEEFYLVVRQAELVMVTGRGVESWLAIWDKSQADAAVF